MATVRVSFAGMRIGNRYSRNDLAMRWGYESYHALARGVVTPSGDNKIILFVTRKKQLSAEQYRDELQGNVLTWEGPRDHFAEDRMLGAAWSGDEIHLFYREHHHTDFAYMGRLRVQQYEHHENRPSQFTFELDTRA